MIGKGNKQPKKIRSWVVLVLVPALGLLVGSCDYVKPDVLIPLNAKIAALSSLVADLQKQDQIHDAEMTKLWRGTHCSNSRISDLIDELRQCESEQCSARSIDQLLTFSTTEPHVVVRLPFAESASQALAKMAPMRGSQLKEKLDPSKVNAATRLIFMAMTLSPEKKVAQTSQSIDAARLLKRDLFEKNRHLGNTPMIGPFLVTCSEKSQLLSSFSKRVREDRPVAEEPKPNAPQIVIWVLKVDC